MERYRDNLCYNFLAISEGFFGQNFLFKYNAKRQVTLVVNALDLILCLLCEQIFIKLPRTKFCNEDREIRCLIPFMAKECSQIGNLQNIAIRSMRFCLHFVSVDSSTRASSSFFGTDRATTLNWDTLHVKNL